MDQIAVIWPSYHRPDIIGRGYWDQAILEEMFHQPQELTYQHLDSFEDFYSIPPEVYGGAVVIINGRTHTEDTEKINADIAGLKWCLFIITGDEEALFPWREIKHPLMRVWIQLPRMNQHDDVSFHLPNGYRPDTRRLLADVPRYGKPNDYFFAGQITHGRRDNMAEAVRALPEGFTGSYTETHSFGEEGIPHGQYIKEMVHSKIALCPSGPETPDTFRLYEALEAGCLPIVDQFSTKHQSPGFWQYLFKGDVPFPIISYWDKLPQLLPELLKGYPENANRCFAWWQQFKRSMRYKLEDDIKELSR